MKEIKNDIPCEESITEVANMECFLNNYECIQGRQWMCALSPPIPFWTSQMNKKKQKYREKQGIVTTHHILKRITRNWMKNICHIQLHLSHKYRTFFLITKSVWYVGNNWTSLKNLLRTPSSGPRQGITGMQDWRRQFVAKEFLFLVIRASDWMRPDGKSWTGRDWEKVACELLNKVNRGKKK